MKMRCSRPLEMDPLPSLQDSIHRQATTEYMPCTSHRVQERGLQGITSLWVAQSSQVHGRPCPPDYSETGRESRKVNSRPLFPQVPLQVKAQNKNFCKTSSFPANLISLL